MRRGSQSPGVATGGIAWLWVSSGNLPACLVNWIDFGRPTTDGIDFYTRKKVVVTRW